MYTVFGNLASIPVKSWSVCNFLKILDDAVSGVSSHTIELVSAIFRKFVRADFANVDFEKQLRLN